MQRGINKQGDEMQVESIRAKTNRKSGKTQEVILTDTAPTTGLQNKAGNHAKLNTDPAGWTLRMFDGELQKTIHSPLFTACCKKRWRREKAI